MKYTHLSIWATGVILAATLSAATARAAVINLDQAAAVIFAYQRVGEDDMPGNISLEQFQEHIAELKKGGYTVLPLPEIIQRIRKNGTLPPKTVGLTFGGAYPATLEKAIPLLKDDRLPFTVFFASDMADGDTPAHLNWKALKKLRKNKLVTLGIFPAGYEHMLNLSAAKNTALINRAVTRYREMLDDEPAFFAWPYGEYNAALQKALATYKFKAVFAQHAGVVSRISDFMALPRFTMTDEHGDLDRFQLTANALPLPVSDITPEDTVLEKNAPLIGFTVAPEVENLSKLSCFASSLGKLPLKRIGGNRVEIRLDKPLTERRNRINCTLPDSSGTRIWRWFGMMLINPTSDEDAGGGNDGDNTPPE